MRNYLHLITANLLMLALAMAPAAKAKEIALDFSVPNSSAMASVEMAKERDRSLSDAKGDRTIPKPKPTVENSRQLARPPTAPTLGDIALNFSVPNTSTVPSVAIAQANSSSTPSSVELDAEPYSTPKQVPTTPSVKGKTSASSFDMWTPNLKMTPKSGDSFVGYPVTSPFGYRVHPVSGDWSFHSGVDLATPENTKIYAIGTPGTPTKLKCWIDIKGGGLVASMRSPSFPNLQFDALHLSWCKSQTNGPWLKVLSGEIIAGTGSTGISTGPHLHFQVRDLDSGKKIPPAKGFIGWVLTGKKPS